MNISLNLMGLQLLWDLLHPITLLGKLLNAVGFLVQFHADGLALFTCLEQNGLMYPVSRLQNKHTQTHVFSTHTQMDSPLPLACVV